MPDSPLAELDATFKQWFGADYDLDAIHATLAAAAVTQLEGDPVWLLVVSGPGNAKTETVCALRTCDDVHVVSTISSSGALLSGTSKGERSEDATGGLLRVVGSSGVIIIKEFSSILSMSQSTRPEVLNALREIYDGKWVRTIGADGGRTLDWEGRITVVGAVTTAWDQAHATVAAMGDRFVLIRTDSSEGRLASGMQSLRNVGSEVTMRDALATACKSVMDNLHDVSVNLTDEHLHTLLLAADLVTMARTAVVREGATIAYAHAPEMPTRFAKQLKQIARGGLAIGMDVEQAMDLALRCARDSVPPLRLEILRDLAAHPRSPTTEVYKRLDKPRTTVDRELQSLHLLGLITCDEETYYKQNGDGGTKWLYSLKPSVDTTVLCPEKVRPKKDVPPLSPEVKPETAGQTRPEKHLPPLPPEGCTPPTSFLGHESEDDFEKAAELYSRWNEKAPA